MTEASATPLVPIPMIGHGKRMTPMLIAAFFIGINLWTIWRFWRDKRSAVAKVRRIPEVDLLGLAIMGGSPGALLARHLFRHKTRKQPFSAILLSIALVQAGLLIGWLLL